MEAEVQKILQDVFREKDMRGCDIPAIDLYMDQIIMLVEGYYGGGARTVKDKPLTKAMINNYSKEGLLSPIKGKKYTKEHILQILTVYLLKDALSIGEIKSALTAMHGGGDELERCYEQAVSARERYLPQLEEQFCALIDDVGADTITPAGRLTALLCAARLAGDLQNIAKRMVKEFFAGE